MADDTNNLDLSAFTYEKWIEFFFDRPVTEFPDELYRLVREGYETFDPSQPEIVIHYLTRLCEDFSAVSDKYSVEQIDSGLWTIFGPDFDTHRYLSERSIPLEKRLQCIRSMYLVYANFVSKLPETEEVENCFDMWWHWVGRDFWSGAESNALSDRCKGDPEAMLKEMGWEPGFTVEEFLEKKKVHENTDYQARFSQLDSDGKQMIEAMFETLCKILTLADPRCQSYALHGLGHLFHPKSKEVVQKFMDENRTQLTPDGLKWLEQCRDGTVL